MTRAEKKLMAMKRRDRERLLRASYVRSGYWKRRRPKLIDYPKPGWAKAATWLFNE